MECAELTKQSLELATALPDRHHSTRHMLLEHVGMLQQTPAMQRATCCWALLPHLHRYWGLFKKAARGPEQAKLQTDWKLIEGGIRGPQSLSEREQWKGEDTQKRGAESWE